MQEILRKYLMVGGAPLVIPSLAEVCLALAEPQSATPEMRAYIDTHPDLVANLRKLGLAPPVPDTDESLGR